MMLGSVVAVTVGVPTAASAGTVSQNSRTFTAQSAPQTWTVEVVKALNPAPSDLGTGTLASNKFGGAVALADTTLVVGSMEQRLSRSAGAAPGFGHVERAFVLERVEGTWVPAVTLSASNQPALGCHGGVGVPDCYEFGRAVAIDPLTADVIVVGAPAEVVVNAASDKSKHGAVYIFERSGTGWTEVARLVSPNPAANDRFGASVAVYGDVLVVGSEGDRADPVNAPNDYHGAAYVFERLNGTWGSTPVAVLRSPYSPLPNAASFGQRVAIWDDTIVVGDRAFTAAAVDKESVHVFGLVAGNWTLQVSIGQIFNQAGHGLVLGDQGLVSGSEWIGGAAQGDAVFVPRGSSGFGTPISLRAVAVAAGQTPAQWFGGAVALDGDVVAVGTGRGTGEVLMFTIDGEAATATFVERLTVPDDRPDLPANPWANNWRFGSAIGVSSDLLVASAPFDCTFPATTCSDGRPSESGSVFTFVNPSRAQAPPPAVSSPVVVLPPELPGLINQPVPTTTLAPVPDPVPATIEPPSSTVPAAPVPLESAALQPGEVEVVSNDVIVSVELVVENQQRDLVLRSDDFQLRLSGECSFECPISTDADGRQVVELEDRGSVLVSGTGFQPASLVDVWLFSEPVLLGQLTVAADGTFAGSLPVVGLTVGSHTLQVSGRSTEGASRAVSLGVVVAAPGIPTPRPTVLPSTGSDLGAAAWIAGLVLVGAVMIRFSRRRLPTV